MRYYISFIAFILIGVVFCLSVFAVDSNIITVDTLKYGAIAIVAICVPFIAKAVIDEIRNIL